MPLLSLGLGILHLDGMPIYLDDTGYEDALGNRSVEKTRGSFVVNPQFNPRVITDERGVREITSVDAPRLHTVNDPARTT